jgi:RNA-directed DNA polymerase
VPGLEESIHQAARAKIAAYDRYLRRVRDENERRRRRSNVKTAQLSPRRPTLWDLDPAFDPFYVRARRKSIAHAIGKRLAAGLYVPYRPGGFYVPKGGGASRLVTAFPIADEVISRRVYLSILRKNRSRLNAHSYAYRADLSVHDAIAHIQSEWRGGHRIFVAQYDFKDFFGSINHEYFEEVVDHLGLTMTDLERQIVSSFLRSSDPYTSLAEKTSPGSPRTRGVPQGTSISLLVANLALTPLDAALERLSVSFARYADDVLIWAKDYGALCQAVELLYWYAEQSGCELNREKSRGIELLVADRNDRAEIAKSSSVSYLSHSIGLRATQMHPRVESQVKARISSFLFNHLIREPLTGTQNLSRISVDLDRDYIAFIWQLRRYIYGNLSETEVRRLQYGSVPARRLSGAIARFPLIDSKDQLLMLDRWIAGQAWLALRRRQKLLGPYVFWTPRPWGISRQSLLGFSTVSSSTGQAVDARMPSLLRMSNVVDRAVRSHGTSVVGHSLGLYGYKV